MRTLSALIGSTLALASTSVFAAPYRSELSIEYGDGGTVGGFYSAWTYAGQTGHRTGVMFGYLPEGMLASVASKECPKCATNPVKSLDGIDLLGRPSGATWADGNRETYSRDRLGRLNALTLTNSFGVQTYSMQQLSYDEWGFVQAYQRVGGLLPGDHQFNYGEQGELRAWRVGAETVTYNYDSQGNLVSRIGAIGDMEPNYSKQYDQRSHAVDWTYDSLGRLLQDDHYRYRYNSAGRLALIEDSENGDIVAAYRYDANGMRVAALEDDKLVLSQRSGDTVFSQLTVTSDGKTERTAYLPFNGSLAQTRHDDGRIENYFQDRMGNPAVRWGSEGEKRQEYSPYGQQLNLTFEDTHQGPGGYTGVHEDDPTGLTYMRARYQDPISARFAVPDPARDFDPLRPATYNLYQYASNNPTNAFDANGLKDGPVPRPDARSNVASCDSRCCSTYCSPAVQSVVVWGEKEARAMSEANAESKAKLDLALNAIGTVAGTVGFKLSGASAALSGFLSGGGTNFVSPPDALTIVSGDEVISDVNSSNRALLKQDPDTHQYYTIPLQGVAFDQQYTSRNMYAHDTLEQANAALRDMFHVLHEVVEFERPGKLAGYTYEGQVERQAGGPHTHHYLKDPAGYSWITACGRTGCTDGDRVLPSGQSSSSTTESYVRHR